MWGSIPSDGIFNLSQTTIIYSFFFLHYNPSFKLSYDCISISLNMHYFIKFTPRCEQFAIKKRSIQAPSYDVLISCMWSSYTHCVRQKYPEQINNRGKPCRVCKMHLSFTILRESPNPIPAHSLMSSLPSLFLPSSLSCSFHCPLKNLWAKDIAHSWTGQVDVCFWVTFIIFLFTIPLSWYSWNAVEKDVKPKSSTRVLSVRVQLIRDCSDVKKSFILFWQAAYSQSPQNNKEALKSQRRLGLEFNIPLTTK